MYIWNVCISDVYEIPIPIPQWTEYLFEITVTAEFLMQVFRNIT